MDYTKSIHRVLGIEEITPPRFELGLDVPKTPVLPLHHGVEKSSKNRSHPRLNPISTTTSAWDPAFQRMRVKLSNRPVAVQAQAQPQHQSPENGLGTRTFRGRTPRKTHGKTPGEASACNAQSTRHTSVITGSARRSNRRSQSRRVNPVKNHQSHRSILLCVRRRGRRCRPLRGGHAHSSTRNRSP